MTFATHCSLLTPEDADATVEASPSDARAARHGRQTAARILTPEELAHTFFDKTIDDFRRGPRAPDGIGVPERSEA